MGKFFDVFKYGLITLFTMPFWLIYMVYLLIKGIFIYIFTGIKVIVRFFSGKSVFTTKEDKAIEYLKEKEFKEKEEKRLEALSHVND